MDSKKIRVAITHGDTNGIGYELILRHSVSQRCWSIVPLSSTVRLKWQLITARR